jgi:hypothetical protein
MQKTVLYLLLILGCTKTNAQQKIDKNNVINYSHMIYGMQGNKALYSGSGFFLYYKKRYFFITAYHAMTGEDPKTQKPLRPKPDRLTIFFHQDTDSLEGYPVPLYKNGKPIYYFALPFDIAAIPLSDKNDYLKKYAHAIDEHCIDTSIDNKAGHKLVAVGYPLDCKLENGWKPCICNMLSVRPPTDSSYKNIYHVGIYYDKPLKPGYSGSPVFQYDSNKTTMKVKGVVSVESASIYIKFVVLLMDTIISKM